MPPPGVHNTIGCTSNLDILDTAFASAHHTTRVWMLCKFYTGIRIVLGRLICWLLLAESALLVAIRDVSACGCKHTEALPAHAARAPSHIQVRAADSPPAVPSTSALTNIRAHPQESLYVHHFHSRKLPLGVPPLWRWVAIAMKRVLGEHEGGPVVGCVLCLHTWTYMTGAILWPRFEISNSNLPAAGCCRTSSRLGWRVPRAQPSSSASSPCPTRAASRFCSRPSTGARQSPVAACTTPNIAKRHNCD